VVPLGVVGDPSPQVLTRLLYAELSLPVELLVGEVRLGSEVEDVTLSAADNLGLDLGCLGVLFSGSAFDHLSEGSDHLLHTGTGSGAQVPGLDTGLVLTKIVEGSKVASGKIKDVDIVADSGAIMANWLAGLVLAVGVCVI
jgi:hypothetical protein